VSGGGPGEVLLAIETSCDETAAAVVGDDLSVRSSVVSSQVDLHRRFGGVVPEVASRAHVECLVPIVAEALARADVAPEQLAAVAATVGPGLIGALLVGVASAKALAVAWERPFVGVNHLEGHLFAASLDAPEIEMPLCSLLVSGGHTMLVLIEAPGRYRLLGETLDDAAGEAYDKVARYLDLGFPGGPAIDRLAATGDPTAVPLPRPMRDEGFDFSFSGLKTAVVRYVDSHPDVDPADLAASFQEAVVDVLVTKTLRAAAVTGVGAVCLGGGVAANSRLRARLAAEAEQAGLRAYLPSRAMCTDNGAMIGAAAWWLLRAEGPASLETGAQADLPLRTLPPVA
jgi:N6-L-threonylcarbamoyladenine synthase